MDVLDELRVASPDDLLRALTVPSRLGERPGLERMHRLLAELGDPHRGLPVLHIGGTSGKGSTATMAARILERAGYRVGLHVKPHLERVEERFVINGAEIPTPRLVQMLRAAAPAARRVGPTWYELTVAIAFQYFRAEQVDLAVVEVGLGGTYDGTNVVQPLVATLTNVGLDHTEILGDTVEQIAADKVGILKRGAVAVSGATQETVREIVARRCAAVGAPLWQLGAEIGYQVRALEPRGSWFDLFLPGRELRDLHLRALGAHQVANAALAVASVEALRGAGFPVPAAAIRAALAAAEIPGRLEIVDTRPLVVLDGAHNPAKMAALAAALETLFPGRRITGVLAFKRGHDLAATLEPILPLLDRAVLTRFDAETDFGPGQSVEPERVAALCTAAGFPDLWQIEPDPRRAVDRARAAAGPEGLVCVTGSLYLVGAVRPLFRGGPAFRDALCRTSSP